ncbi:MAG: hypothetical protein HYZ49_06655 [Chloroflexi bacterium]|nr:hypothetical protein [Chloroflexota bacterium]
MADAILWIARNQQWIYLALILAGAWQLWRWWRAQRRLQFTYFGVEREALISSRGRATALAFFVLTLMAAVLLLNVFIAPNLTELFGVPPTPTSSLPTHTPAPTWTPFFILPGLESPTAEVADSPLATRTPVPAAGSGCLNPNATIDSPIPGAILAGEVEVRGTASIENFAFYKVEISTLGENWLPVITSQLDPNDNTRTLPVVDGLLGTWDTRLQEPGAYALRLVVVDAAGQNPEPCTIPIIIQEPLPPTPTP